jgi:bacteriorhodopsin
MSTLLIITSIIFATSAGFFYLKKESSLMNKISILILLIASSNYLIMSQFADYENIRALRYIDWFLTVPLLVYQMCCLFMKKPASIKTCGVSLLMILLMLVCGLSGELGISKEIQMLDIKPHEWKPLMGMLGIGFSLNAFLFLTGEMKEANDLKLFIIIISLWQFYPIVYFLADNQYTIIGYSIADVLAKVGGAFVMAYFCDQCHMSSK